tara:strand:+ start:7232 stop:7909 length:678 start_codon:yes stop_codon:yes gene_type:complete
MSTSISPDVLKNTIPERHSLFQLKYFVIGKEPTLQGKLWQCLREIKTRQEALETMNLEIVDAKDSLELMELDIEKTKMGLAQFEEEDLTPEKRLDLKIVEINLRKAVRRKEILEKQLATIEDKIKYKKEEIAFFEEAFESLEKIEKVKDFDDPKAQTQYWSEKLAHDLNLRALMRAPMDMELIKTVLALPDNAPIKLQTVNMIEGQQHALLAQQNLEKKEEGKDE